MKNKNLLITGLFCLSLMTANAQYTDLHDFNLSDGADPYGSLALSGNVLYGVTMAGGANWVYNDGNIFSVNTNGSSFKDLFDFNGGNGRNPNCVMAISGTTMYGLTWMGAGGNYGDIFSITTAGASYTDMHDFNNINGANPRGSLTLAGNVMYGTTESGGAYGYGSIFSVNKDGSGFKDLFDFNNTNGGTPKGSLLLSGSILYGMTEVGGAFNNGNIFSINTNGSNFIDLFDFNGTDGASPQGSLLISGSKLYGMTYSGGTHNGGEVFSINTNGTGFKDMHNFTGPDGNNPAGDLTLCGHLFYGMLSGGGTNDYGRIFSIDSNGNSYTDVYDFDYTNGAYPFGTLTLSGNMMYGMTEGGGAGGCGVVFSLKLNNTLSISITNSTNVTCNGDNNGKAIANAASGGTLPYTYSWSPGGGNSLTASNLSAGSYTITVTDNNGFTATASTAITQAPVLEISVESVTRVICERTASITSHAATGGALPYKYSWSPGGETGLTVSNLGPGTYTITATDNNGCTATASETITLPAKLTVATTITSSIGCNGEQTGGLKALASGGTPAYAYSWFPTEGTYSVESNLKAGTYFVTVTDSNGCSATASETITEPSPIILKTETVNVKGPEIGLCNGNASVAVTSGGVAPYKYLWSGGQTTDTIKNQCAGSYCCVVTDANGCSQTACVTVSYVTGIDAVSDNATSINVYPNPTTSQVNINGVEKGMTIGMYDNLGREVSNLIADNETMQFNMINQQTGMYLIRILAKDGSLVSEKKLVKTN